MVNSLLVLVFMPHSTSSLLTLHSAVPMGNFGAVTKFLGSLSDCKVHCFESASKNMWLFFVPLQESKKQHMMTTSALRKHVGKKVPKMRQAVFCSKNVIISIELFQDIFLAQSLHFEQFPRW